MIVKLLTETSFGVSKLKRRLQRLVQVYTCQNATLLEISCTGSYVNYMDVKNASGYDQEIHFYQNHRNRSKVAKKMHIV